MARTRKTADTVETTVSDTSTQETAPRGRRTGINRVILVGRLTKDPELRYTDTGIPVVSMRLATNERPEPEFHDVVAWRQLAETCARYLTKGRLVYLEGRLHGRSWVATDGGNRRAVEVVADTLRMLAPRPETLEQG